MWLANLLIYKQNMKVKQQTEKVNSLIHLKNIQYRKAKDNVSTLIARPDTLFIIFAAGWLKGHLSHSSDSKAMASSSLLLRLLQVAM